VATRPVRPASLILTGLLGVGLTLLFYWLWNTHPGWFWPWGAPVLVVVVGALLVWAFADHQRRRQA